MLEMLSKSPRDAEQAATDAKQDALKQKENAIANF